MYTLECETITPTFNKPFNYPSLAEIRIPSIKGILRYWYRALFFEKDTTTLYKKETEVFGGMGTGDFDGKSSKLGMNLRMHSTNFITTAQPVPNKKFTSAAVKIGTKFTLSVKFYRMDPNEEDNLKALLKTALTLGGVGQRARRGMGSISLSKENGQPIEPLFEKDQYSRLLKGMGIKHSIKHNTIQLNTQNRATYPILQEIRFGKERNQSELEDLLYKVGHMKKIKGIKDVHLGGVMRKRFGSPVWVKILKNDQKIRPVYSIFYNTEARNQTDYLDDVERFVNGIEGED